MVAQFISADKPAPDRSLLEHLTDFVLSMKFLAVLFSCVLIATFDEAQFVYLGLVTAIAVVFTFTPLARHASIVARCILPFLIGRLCVEAYVFVQTHSVFGDVTKYLMLDNFYKEPFYTSISTLYAIITALALVKSIEVFDVIKGNVASEAHKIQAMLELTRYFGPGNDTQTVATIKELRELLHTYARNVAALKDTTLNAVNVGLLRQCQDAIAGINTADENDRYALRKLMDERSELAALRVERISSIGDTMPTYLISALWLVSAALILPFFAAPLSIADPNDALHMIVNPTRYTQYYMIFFMGTLYSFLLLMLSDINDPFDGFWTVDMQAFEELGKTELAPEHITTQTTVV